MIKNNLIIFIFVLLLILYYDDKKNYNKINSEINKVNFTNTQDISLTYKKSLKDNIKKISILAKKIQDNDSVYRIPSNLNTTGVLYVSGNLNFFPEGIIVIWTKNEIPYGWVECNGQNIPGFGTVPDLRGRVALAADLPDTSKNNIIRPYPSDNNTKIDGYSAYNDTDYDEDKKLIPINYTVGETGGERKHPLKVSEMPSHHHRIYGNADDEGYPKPDTNKYGFQASDRPLIQEGKHYEDEVDSNTISYLEWKHGGNTGYTQIYNTGGPGNDRKHSRRQPHSGNPYGSVQPHNNMPPYYVLKYIMKVNVSLS